MLESLALNIDQSIMFILTIANAIFAVVVLLLPFTGDLQTQNSVTGRKKMTARFYVLTAFTTLSAVFTILISSVSQKQQDEATQKIHEHIKESDDKTIEMLAQYNLEVDSSTRQIKKTISSQSYVSQPFVRPRLEIFSRDSFVINIENASFNAAYDISASYLQFSEINGEYKLDVRETDLLMDARPSLASQEGYPIKMLLLKPGYDRDSIMSIIDIEWYSENRKRQNRRFPIIILPKQRLYGELSLKRNPKFYSFLKKNKY